MNFIILQIRLERKFSKQNRKHLESCTVCEGKTFGRKKTGRLG